MLIKKEQAAQQARALLKKEYHGVLSTHSHKIDGYPFGSIVPYCLDEQGVPIILISHLAEHTKNIKHNEKVSLTITQTGVDDIQTAERVSWLGNAEPALDEAIHQRYYRYFPQSRDYHKTHDFSFYRIACVRGRYIGGFGKIFWLASEQLHTQNPFFDAQEIRMIEHMNHDHLSAIRQYCKNIGISANDHTPKLTGIDADGFHVLINQRVIRINFPQPATTPESVRKHLVAMASDA